jgi:hypothetical protein
MCSRSKRPPHRFGRLQPTLRRVCLLPTDRPVHATGARPTRFCYGIGTARNRIALRCSPSEKSLFMQGIRLTSIPLLNQVRQSIVHVLYEWAKAVRVPLGRARRACQNTSARGPRMGVTCTYAEDEWLRHRNQQPREWQISAGFRGACPVSFLHGSISTQVAPAHCKAQNALAGASRLKQPSVVGFRSFTAGRDRSWGYAPCRGIMRQT